MPLPPVPHLLFQKGLYHHDRRSLQSEDLSCYHRCLSTSVELYSVWSGAEQGEFEMQARGGDKKNSSLSKRKGGRREEGKRQTSQLLCMLYRFWVSATFNENNLSELSMFLANVNLNEDLKIEDLCKLEKQSNVMTKKYQQCWYG